MSHSGSVRRLIRIAMIAAAAGCFAYFVWPTPWTYFGAGSTFTYRRNRITGELQCHYLKPGTPQNWIPVYRERVPEPPPKTILDRMREFAWTPGKAIPRDLMADADDETRIHYMLGLLTGWEELESFRDISPEYLEAVFGHGLGETLRNARQRAADGPDPRTPPDGE